ncbi:hypothetical protein HK104_009308, partial [Borealophlyctis nickersoniae]
MAEMSRAVTKLASFKQSVMQSLANDDELLASVGAAGGSGGGGSGGLGLTPGLVAAAARDTDELTGLRSGRLSGESHRGIELE